MPTNPPPLPMGEKDDAFPDVVWITTDEMRRWTALTRAAEARALAAEKDNARLRDTLEAAERFVVWADNRLRYEHDELPSSKPAAMRKAIKAALSPAAKENE